MESAIEQGLARHGWWNLRLIDRDDFSVFRVNQWEASLFAIRDRYRERVDVRPYFAGPLPRPKPAWTLPEWKRYYGVDAPPLMKRIRIRLGRWRRSVLQPS